MKPGVLLLECLGESCCSGAGSDKERVKNCQNNPHQTDKIPHKYPLKSQKCCLLWPSDGVLRAEAGLVLSVAKSCLGRA